MIDNFKRNNVGTVCFHGRFGNMRKAQQFIVYPLKADADPTRLLIQSDTRIGYVNLTTGDVALAGPHAGGAYDHHLAFRKPVGRLSGVELLLLKSNVMATASGRAGTNGVVHCDNSGALNVMGGAA